MLQHRAAEPRFAGLLPAHQQRDQACLHAAGADQQIIVARLPVVESGALHGQLSRGLDLPLRLLQEGQARLPADARQGVWVEVEAGMRSWHVGFLHAA